MRPARSAKLLSAKLKVDLLHQDVTMPHLRAAVSIPGLLALAFLSACKHNPPGGPPPAVPAVLPAPAAPAPAAASTPPGPAWRPLFDGRTLEGWKKAEFGGEAEPRVESGKLILPLGEPMTGVTWTREFPKVD